MTSNPDDTKRPLVLHLAVCDSLSQAPDGKMTLYGIFNRITVEKVPSAQAEIALFMTLGYGRPGKYVVRFTIKGPSGTLLLSSPLINFELKDDKAIHNINIRFQGLPLPEEGPYRASVFFDDEKYPVEERLLFFVEKRKV